MKNKKGKVTSEISKLVFTPQATSISCTYKKTNCGGFHVKWGSQVQLGGGGAPIQLVTPNLGDSPGSQSRLLMVMPPTMMMLMLMLLLLLLLTLMLCCCCC